MAAILSTSFAAPVTDWAVQWSLASVTGVQIGHLCAAENELAQVTKVGPAGTLTVRRGVEGTAVTSHAPGTAVAVYVASAVGTSPAPVVVATPPPRQKTTMLTHAQITTLPTTRVEIVPAPGLGRVIVASAVHGGAECFVLNFVRTLEYANMDGATKLRVRLGTSGPWTNYNNAIPFLSATHSSLYIPSAVDYSSVGANTDWYDEFENIPVNVSLVNGALGNLTGGDAANVLYVTIGYRVYDLTTQQFID